MIREAISKVVEGQNLTEEEATATMNEIMSGEATPAQIASFITALSMKGETVDEITGCAKVMREKVTKIQTSRKFLVDTCGTGGDRSHTFNISTAAALVSAGAGVAIAKHGNRAASSRCGSADVLQALGVNIEAAPEKVSRCLDEIGIGFLFAPLLHSAMKHAIGPRREIGIRTIFNILGPLTNPAGAQAQLLGVSDPKLTALMAGVLKNLGSKRAFVVHGQDGLDEITTTAETFISELVAGQVKSYKLNPNRYGISLASDSELKGGTAEENAQIVSSLLKGEKSPKRDVVLLNAAVAIMAGEKAKTVEEGIQIAAESIDSGKALQKLQALIEMTH